MCKVNIVCSMHGACMGVYAWCMYGCVCMVHVWVCVCIVHAWVCVCVVHVFVCVCMVHVWVCSNIDVYAWVHMQYVWVYRVCMHGACMGVF